MAAYLDVDRMTATEVRGMRLAMLTTLAALESHGNPDDDALDAVNTLVREAVGPREIALHFARASAFLLLGASDDEACSLVRLTALALEAAEDVKFDVEFDEALDHSLSHGWSGGGPDPDCHHCTAEEDA